MKGNSLKDSYIPTELNFIFTKGTKHLMKSFKLFFSSPKPPDFSLLECQINITLEKFAHDLLKRLIITQSKFVQLPSIQRSMKIPYLLHFLVL